LVSIFVSNFINIFINHNEVSRRKIAIIFLKVTNHLPGFGIIDIIFGNNIIRIRGNDKPRPIIKRMEKISKMPPDKAKPTAVPTNGAVHGVANKVNVIPVMKSPTKPSPLYDRIFKIFGGKKKLNNPNRLRPKKAVSKIIKIRKDGF
tara:strand:+ start:46 stop:486 length:441 start_codon:yes stop_codon:yes gene_type:complete